MRTEIINGKPYDVEETLDDIFSYNREIDFITEYDGHYYVRLKPKSFYEGAMWKVEKRTKKVVAVICYGPEYLCTGIAQKAIPIDPATLRRGA